MYSLSLMLSLFRRSIKRSLSGFLIVALLVVGCYGNVCHAHERREHDAILNRVLFGRETGFPNSWEDGLVSLQNASYLAVDQANGYGQTELQALRDYGVSGLPRSIDSIDVSGNYTHRQYTHMGWDYSYPDAVNANRWSIRKKILVNTVGKVFNFTSSFNWETFSSQYTQRADSMAAFIYYIHLLGDYQYDFSEDPYQYYGSRYMLQLASGATGRTSVISELKNHMRIIFADQVSTYSFNDLITTLDTCDTRIYAVISTSSEELTDEQYEELNDATSDVIDKLEQYVPGLLRNEVFFNYAFPENGGESSSIWDWLPWHKNE